MFLKVTLKRLVAEILFHLSLGNLEVLELNGGFTLALTD